MAEIDPRYHRRKKAIEEALDVLGPQARTIIIAFLADQKKITSNYCSSIEEIGASLKELFGSGAALIMDSIAVKELKYY